MFAETRIFSMVRNSVANYGTVFKIYAGKYFNSESYFPLSGVINIFRRLRVTST